MPPDAWKTSENYCLFWYLSGHECKTAWLILPQGIPPPPTYTHTSPIISLWITYLNWRCLLWFHMQYIPLSDRILAHQTLLPWMSQRRKCHPWLKTPSIHATYDRKKRSTLLILKIKSTVPKCHNADYHKQILKSITWICTIVRRLMSPLMGCKLSDEKEHCLPQTNFINNENLLHPLTSRHCRLSGRPPTVSGCWLAAANAHRTAGIHAHEYNLRVERIQTKWDAISENCITRKFKKTYCDVTL